MLLPNLDWGQLLIDLAHDLRAPTSSIQGIATALEQGIIQEPEKVRRFGSHILLESFFISTLMENLSFLAQISDEGLSAPEDAVEISSLLDAVASELFPSAASRDIKLVTTLPQQQLYINANAELIAQAFRNLLLIFLRYSRQELLTIKGKTIASTLEVKFLHNLRHDLDYEPFLFLEQSQIPRQHPSRATDLLALTSAFILHQYDIKVTGNRKHQTGEITLTIPVEKS